MEETLGAHPVLLLLASQPRRLQIHKVQGLQGLYVKMGYRALQTYLELQEFFLFFFGKKKG